MRALARDIGEAAGTVAHLAALRRTRAGEADIADACALANLVDVAGRGELSGLFVDPVRMLGMPVATVDPALATDGRPLSIALAADAHAAPEIADGDLVAVTDGRALIGIYRREGDRFVPETVLAGGVPL